MRASARFLRKPTFGSPLMVLVVIALALTLVTALFGQAYFGTVSGELTDATGAVVTGARVVLTDQQKGFHFDTISDSSGRYLFRSIPPGVYVVNVQASGFGKTESAGFKVDINENTTANMVLKVAALLKPYRSRRELRQSRPKTPKPGRWSIAGSSMICL